LGKLEECIKNYGFMINYEKKDLASFISYSVWEYILRIFIVGFFSIIIFYILGNNSDPLSSYISSSIAFLFITIFSSVILFKSQKWVWFFIMAFLIKILLGLIHYLYFIDPEYFRTGLYKSLTWEFESVFDNILRSAHEKVQHGALYYQYSEGGIDHQEIISIISIPFAFFGDYVLTITPINTYCSLLLSMNILLISKYQFNVSATVLKYIAVTTAYFPMFFIPSLLYRDIVGLGIMSIGMVLVLFSKKTIVKYCMLVVACYLFYMHRTIYPVIILMAFVINSVFFHSYNTKGNGYFYKVVTIILSIVAFSIIVTYTNTEGNQAMASGAFSFNFLFLPVKIILGLIGPFPWNQFMQYKEIPANSYQLQDYLQGTFNVTVVTILILYRKKYFLKEKFNLMNITGGLLILVGLFNAFMHMTYVAIGFIFMLPWIFSVVNMKYFRKIYINIFLIILFLNLMIFAFFGNLGIKSLLE